MAKKYSIVGKSLPKVDAAELVTGQAKYSIDEFMPGMLIGRILTNPHAHANILSIDTSEAEALPGVRAVLTHKDVLPIGIRCDCSIFGETKVLDSKVRYVGDEVAAVAAETEEIAEAALKLIDVQYEVLPSVFDPEEALESNAPILYPEFPGGNMITGQSWITEDGDIQQGFAQSDRIYEGVFTTFPQAVAPLGRLCSLAWWEGDNLKVIDSTQEVFWVAARLAAWLDIPLNKVRATSKFMGAGMGDQNVYRYSGISAYLARKTNRPVKVITDNKYSFVGSAKRRADAKIYMKVGVKDDGTLMAMSARVIWDKGADASGGPGPMMMEVCFKGLYDCPNMKDEIIGVYTNTPPNGSYRSWGSSESYWALEGIMEKIVNDLGMDPLDFYLKNMAAARSKKTLEIAAERAGWSEKWSPPSSKTGTKRKGIGMGTIIGWMAGYGFPHSSASIQLNEDGTVFLNCGLSDIGQGPKTTMVQVAAEVLGVKYEDVTIFSADTTLPPDLGSYASRIALNCGIAVNNAAEDLKSKLLAIVAPMLEVNPEDLDSEDGMIFVKANPSIAMTFKDATAAVGGWGLRGYLLGWGCTTVGWAGPIQDINPISAMVAEVEVDTETGQVEVTNITDVFDVGHCLNRAICETQMAGNACIGIGMALTEDIVLDPTTGASLNCTNLGYRLPSILDVPTMDLLPYEDEPNPCAPHGQRGVGESSLALTQPAIHNAIYNAIGVNIPDAPMSPDRILKALGKV